MLDLPTFLFGILKFFCMICFWYKDKDLKLVFYTEYDNVCCNENKHWKICKTLFKIIVSYTYLHPFSIYLVSIED